MKYFTVKSRIGGMNYVVSRNQGKSELSKAAWTIVDDNGVVWNASTLELGAFLAETPGTFNVQVQNVK